MIAFTPCSQAESSVFTPDELKRIEYMRANGILLDPDGFDTVEEIRAALALNVWPVDAVPVFHCVECGKEFVGAGRLCARCYVAVKL